VDWKPEATSVGFISEDMIRSLLQAEYIGFSPHIKGQF
jgi:hypothetical protein